MSKSSSSLVRVASSLFFFSGFAALIYEVIWFKRFTHVWGSSSLAQMVVVTAFLFGLSLGAFALGRVADRVRSPLVWYSVCEISIGAFALVIPYEIIGLRWLASAMYPLLQANPAFHFVVRFVLTFLVIGPPCILMGGTLPLLMKHFLIVRPWSRETTGWLYAVNTLGAAFGSFFTGFYFLPSFGAIGTNWLAAAMNFYIALLVYLLLKQTPKELSVEERVREPDLSPFPLADSEASSYFSARTIYVASALTGCAALILQMVWTRNLAVVLGGTTYAFSSMLFVFLFGIGLGSLIYSRTVRRIRNIERALIVVVTALIASTAMGKFSVPFLAATMGFLRGLRADALLNGLISVGANAVLQLVPTLCMGFLFPLFVDILRWRKQNVGAMVGNLYTWNTAGSILGASFTPVALIAVWGTAASTAVAMLMYCLALSIVFPYRRRKSILGLSCAVLLTAVLWFPTSKTDDPRLTNMGQYIYGYIPSVDVLSSFNLLYFKEGSSCNVMVLESDVNRHLRVNGKVDAGDAGDMPMQTGLAYYPRLFRPGARNVLVIGYGSGTTAGASLAFENTRVTCCEIEPAVVEAGVLFSHVNHQPERSRNYKMVLDDGRNFLEGCGETFDLILSEPSNPWMAGVSNLFTREFYREARRRLSPNGVFTQWIHTYNFTGRDYALVARTLMDVFPHVALVCVTSSDTLLLASDRSLQPTLGDIEAAQKVVDDSPVVSEDLEILFNTKDVKTLLLKNYMMPDAVLRRFVAEQDDGDINTDTNMLLEFTAPLQLFVPKELQENVDRVLLESVEPSWWIECYREWSCTAEQAPALKVWIRRLLGYDCNGKCEELLAFALDLLPGDAYLLAERLYFLRDDPAAFDRTLERLVSLSPDEAYRIALSMREKRLYAQAAKTLEKVVEQRPSWATALTHLALCRVDLERYAEAEEAFALAEKADPNNPFLIESYQTYRKKRSKKL